MTNITKSNTDINEKDYWRTPPSLVDDALRLLNIPIFSVDVCSKNIETSIKKSLSCITEEQDALTFDHWFIKGISFTSFCNPPFSKKWDFFQKAKEQVLKYARSVLMVLPYTPCTKEWVNNVHSTNCIIYVPDGRYQYLLPDGSKAKGSCNFETVLVHIVPFTIGNVIINYKRGL